MTCVYDASSRRPSDCIVQPVNNATGQESTSHAVEKPANAASPTENSWRSTNKKTSKTDSINNAFESIRLCTDVQSDAHKHIMANTDATHRAVFEMSNKHVNFDKKHTICVHPTIGSNDNTDDSHGLSSVGISDGPSHQGKPA